MMTRRHPNAAAALLAASALLATAAGCRQEMYDQPRLEPYEASSFFDDGLAMRDPVPGTVSRESLDPQTLLASGMVDGQPADQFPFPIDRKALEWGRQRYGIYCAPCHGATGAGDGMIVQRGFPAPPPFYGPRPKPTAAEGGPVSQYADLRDAPAGHFFRVMTEGHGVMYSYAARVSTEDRWKIAAYIRALQLSQHATKEDLSKVPNPTAEEKQLLGEAGQ